MKEFLKKIPWWCWVLFPIAVVLLAVMFFRSGNGPGWLGKPPSDPGMRPGSVAVTPEQGEEIKEEIHEKAEARRVEIDKKHEDEIAKKADELRELLK